MRRLFGIVLFVLLGWASPVDARGVPPNTGCLVWNNRVYTVWYKNDYPPENPYWGPFDFFDSSGTTYTVVYYPNYPTCTGCINPNFQFNNTHKTCFIQMPDGTYEQGALGTIHDLVQTNVPLDDHVWLLVLPASVIGVALLRKYTLGA